MKGLLRPPTLLAGRAAAPEQAPLLQASSPGTSAARLGASEPGLPSLKRAGSGPARAAFHPRVAAHRALRSAEGRGGAAVAAEKLSPASGAGAPAVAPAGGGRGGRAGRGGPPPGG